MITSSQSPSSRTEARAQARSMEKEISTTRLQTALANHSLNERVRIAALARLECLLPKERRAAQTSRRKDQAGKAQPLLDKATACICAAIESDSTKLRRQAALSLGRLTQTGDKQVITALATASDSSDSVLARFASFSSRLLEHRLQLPVPATTFPEGKSFNKAKAIALESRQVENKRLNKVITTQLLHSFGADLRTDTAIDIGCNDEQWIVPTKTTLEPSRTWSTKPQVLAVVISPTEANQPWSADMVILGTPTKSAIQLRAFTSSGRLLYTGTAQVEGPGIHLHMQTTATSNLPPTDLTGTLTPTKIDFALIRQAPINRPSKSPRQTP